MKTRVLTLVVSCAIIVTFVAGCGRGPQGVTEISTGSSGRSVTELATTLTDDDWGGWRGPTSNGIANSQDVPTRWSEQENIVWKSKIPGRGHSAPTVVGNGVFVATADESSQVQSVIALDRSDGSHRWTLEISREGFPPKNQMHPKSSHANATLASDGQRLFGAFLANGVITAFGVSTSGDLLWKRTVCGFESKFGYAPSPLVYKSTMILAADNRGGGCLAALDRESGEIVWRKSRPPVSSYSSPVVASVAGRDQLFISGGDTVNSYDPNTGDLIWSCPGTTEATCGTIVWNDNHVFASGGFPGRQTLCVAADGSRQVAWSNSAKLYEPSLILVGDLLFGVTDSGIGYCWDAKTGQQKWKERVGGDSANFSASPVAVNDLIFVTNDAGKTVVFKATSDGFSPVSENQLGSDTFATLAIAGNQIFLRVGVNEGGQRQEYMYCIGNPASLPSGD